MTIVAFPQPVCGPRGEPEGLLTASRGLSVERSTAVHMDVAQQLESRSMQVSLPAESERHLMHGAVSS
jgi:hypothetical protein